MPRPLHVLAAIVATGTLSAQQPQGKPSIVRLKAATLDVAARLPLALRQSIAETLPESLAGRRVSTQGDAKQLAIDVDGDGRYFETKVTPRKPLVVTLPGEPKRELVIGYDGSAWFGGPARMLTGKLGRTPIMMLDGDLDGRFDGAGDWIAFGDGPLHRQVPDLPLLGDGEFLGRFRLVADGSGWQLEVQLLGPEPSQSPLQWRALVVANACRTASGLPPVRLDALRCEGCQKHAEYLKLNNYDYSKPWDGIGSHHEDPAKPGYTKEGERAAHDNSTSGTADAAGAIEAEWCTMLHRLSFIGPATGGLGVGAVEGASNPSADGYSVVGCPDAEPRSLAEVVVVPAPGQRRVRTTARDERPPVEAIPSFYDTERGYPISVTFGKLPLRATKLRLLDAKGNAIAGECFTPERPIHSSRPSNGATAFFIARAPLASDAEYTVEFAAEHAGAPLVWRWTFRTQ